MGVVWLGVVPAVSSVALCAGHLWCGWRGHVVVLRPVGALDIGGGVWEFGCVHLGGVG